MIGAKWRSQRPAARGEYRLCWYKQATEKWTGFPTSHTDDDSSSWESATNSTSGYFTPVVQYLAEHLPCDGWKASEGFFECFASCMVLELHGSSNSRRKKLGVGALASTFLGRFSVDFQADVGSLLVQGLRFLQHTFASVAKNARLE